MNLDQLLEEHADNQKESEASEGTLRAIVEEAERLKACKELLDKITKFQKSVKEQADKLEKDVVPSLMQEAGLESLALSDGGVIKVEEDLSCSITKANNETAMAWLRDNGFGGIIKTYLSLEYGRGDYEEAEKARKEIEAHTGIKGMIVEEKVHHSTLKSFCTEQVEAGSAIPFDTFGIYPYTKAVFKKGK